MKSLGLPREKLPQAARDHLDAWDFGYVSSRVKRIVTPWGYETPGSGDLLGKKDVRDGMAKAEKDWPADKSGLEYRRPALYEDLLQALIAQFDSIKGEYAKAAANPEYREFASAKAAEIKPDDFRVLFLPEAATKLAAKRAAMTPEELAAIDSWTKPQAQPTS